MRRGSRICVEYATTPSAATTPNAARSSAWNSSGPSPSRRASYPRLTMTAQTQMAAAARPSSSDQGRSRCSEKAQTAVTTRAIIASPRTERTISGRIHCARRR